MPFSDLTSGTETYQAGRYMDIDPQSSGVYVVDFNLAYHPYCYYNAEYDCPFPPSENRLKTPDPRRRTAPRRRNTGAQPMSEPCTPSSSTSTG